MKTFFISLVTLCALALSSVGSPAAAVDIQKDNLYPRVKFVTNKGEMIVELDRWRAPVTVDHFLTHVVSGSYDSTLFHRVVDNFVVQGGGYKTDWTPLPEGDTVINESGNGLPNRFGTIAMARQQDPHSARRQFYFNTNDNDSLNPNPRRWGYAVFGRVVENEELLRELMAVATDFNEEVNFPDVPVEPIVLMRVELLPEPQAE